MDFLTSRPQCVRMGEHTSPSLTLSTGCPQGIVLSPLLYTLNTHDCIATHSSNTVIKFADDTTIIDITIKDDMGPYREEVKLLTEWCATKNLALNVNKTKELIIDFRKVGKNAQTTKHWRHVGGKSEQLQDPRCPLDQGSYLDN
ncbi:hypothetical protein NFI96_000674 [Prochilodus magdalenae]|nr:hypothetical protein NFI96_000674 [Prochilodus magdalenae]